MKGESAQFYIAPGWWLIPKILEQVVSLMRGNID